MTLAATTSTGDPPAGTARFERRAMGSPLRLTVAGAGAGAAAAAWAAVSDLVEELEEALSRFRPSSALTELNRRAGDPAPAPVNPWLARALAAADRAHRLTGGAFDPRVAGDLERLGYRGADLGRDLTVTRATGERGSAHPSQAADRWLWLDPRRRAAAVTAPIDLGGIGKGLALRWALRALARALPGLGSSCGALLEAGGDLVASGPAPQRGPWLVGIEDPRGGADVAVVTVADGAVTTSSTRVHAWRTRSGAPAHHLIDPRTGEPGGAGLVAVTVAGPDPAWAEVWSKALFLEGSRAVAGRARGLGLAAWWIRDDGSLEMTPAARVRTAWVAAEA